MKRSKNHQLPRLLCSKDLIELEAQQNLCMGLAGSRKCEQREANLFVPICFARGLSQVAMTHAWRAGRQSFGVSLRL